MSSDNITAKIAEGVAVKLHYIHQQAFNDAQRWLIAELRRLADASQGIGQRDILYDGVKALANLIPSDKPRARYAIYLDHFEAKLAGRDPTLAPETAEERAAAANGTMDATAINGSGIKLNSLVEMEADIAAMFAPAESE